MSDTNGSDGITRNDFLKAAGLAALAPLLMGASRAEGAGGAPRERLYVVTHGDNDVDRAALALLLAGLDAKKIGKEFSSVTIWFTLHGAKLCRKGAGEKLTSPIFKKFGTLADILGGAVKAGAKLGACPFCVDYYEIKKEEYIDGLERKGGDYVVAQVGKAEVLWL